MRDTVEITRSYYNSDDADQFYATIWGGEDIHIGIYDTPDESIFDASRRTVERMASMLDGIGAHSRILDLGSGYGGSARFLAAQFRTQVTCLNLSEVQNERNRALNRRAGLDEIIAVIDGSFESIPTEAAQFDHVWSQDAILHSGDRKAVLAEVARVLKPGGTFVFTDPMQRENVPIAALRPVLERIHLDSMGSVAFYRCALKELGFQELAVHLMTEQLVTHYARVRNEITAREAALMSVCSRDYIERMKLGLDQWVGAGTVGNLEWGILHFKKSAEAQADHPTTQSSSSVAE